MGSAAEEREGRGDGSGGDSLVVRLDGDRLVIGDRFWVSFQRTLRVPDDGRDYPLPPGLGSLPLVPAERLSNRLPAGMGRQGSFLMPMYQREAVWLAFGAAHWKPNAAKVGVGSVNAVTGGPWNDGLGDDPQDYLVCPGQPWLDGFLTAEGRVRQFVAMPLGEGYTVEEQLTTDPPAGGLRIRVFDPKPGRFPDVPPPAPGRTAFLGMADPTMGLGAGGRIVQKLYRDPYGLETWDVRQSGQALIHICNSLQYRELTGDDPPPTPVDARVYTEHGLPWFSIYDEDQKALSATAALSTVKSIAETEGDAVDPSVDVDPRQIRGVRADDG